MNTEAIKQQIASLDHGARSVHGALIGRDRPLAADGFGMLLMGSALHIKVKSLAKMVREAPIDQPIDPDGQLDAALCDIQRDIAQGHAMARGLSHNPSARLSWWLRLFFRTSAAQHHTLHRRVEALRQHVLEHDADCAPRGAVFTDAESLIQHLRRANTP